MNKRILISAALAASLALGASAQRFTDVLDRGLVAMKTDAGVFCSWRINADEWENTEYNIYRGNTKLNSAPLRVSNFTDPNGSTSDTYTVKAVVNGTELEASKPASVWGSNYTIITPKHPAEITHALTPNDATVADVDGDGELEIIMKYDNTNPDYHASYTVIECLEMDGTVLWWIDCGPNMGDFQNNEINIAAYDWDMDGKAEVVFRAADATVIHMADGSTYTVGDASINYRGTSTEWPSGQWFMRWGREYLVYADGMTGKPYDCIDYPLKRVEDENNPNGLLEGSAYDTLISNEWGDGYGHRSSKYFFAAPYLDGKHPSIFLARGIYTKHKMITYDVDLATHKLKERWRWNSNGGDWHGQGYHNMGIADVDWDGRDEIVYGSMVIDDNGYGLSTTGLGHGDSQHCGDFDPYSHGQEIFACNEDSPKNNFRDATTSKIYYRTTGGDDDGRANCGNFIDEYPGSEALSSKDDALISGASHKAIVGDSKNTVTITQNFRVFWDGDLCDESFDYGNGKNTEGVIYKAKKGKIATLSGSKTNNDTKGTPCFQGDILGDWREEYIMRDGDNNIRIYSTNIPTDYRIYSLWYDHQYRNAMVWQMCGYNQTPHVSFALSEFEDITVPPYPITLTGRTEVANNGTIDAALNGKTVVVSENNDLTVNAGDAVSPAVLVVNAPTWVQGHTDNNNITTTTYTHTIASGTFGGEMKLVKQGDGKLVMPSGTHTYSGNTDVWAGTLVFDGELTNSPIWLNRFGVLETSSLNAPKGIDMNYASVLKLGDDKIAGNLTTSTLTLGFGAIVEIDMFSDFTADCINASKLIIEYKDWTNGPEYLQPILRLTDHPADGDTTLPQGRYLLGSIAQIEGSLDDLIIEGLNHMKKELLYEDGKLYLEITNFATAVKTWTGAVNNVWDIDNSVNFKVNETFEPSSFYPGDELVFDDEATVTDVNIVGNLMPKSLTFNNEEKNYTISGDGSIVGETSLVKNGAGKLTINNVNQFTGGVRINGGMLVANSFANTIGTDYGALSSTSNRIYLSNKAALSSSSSVTIGHRVSISNNHGVISVPKNVTITMQNGVTTTNPGQMLYKEDQGTLALATGNSVSRLVIVEGTVEASENDNNKIDLPNTVEFINGSLYDPSNIYSYSTNSTNFVVEEGNKGSLYLDSRCDYTGKLTGAGQFTVYAAGPRNTLSGDWSAFEGTLIANQQQRGSSYDPDFTWSSSKGLPKATLNIASGTTFNAGSLSVELGTLTGSGTLYTTGTVTVGGNDKAFNFAGTYSGNPALVKKGIGDWKITKAISGVKSITVTDGTISLDPSKTTTNVCEMPVTLRDNALMRGRAMLTSLNVQSGATVQPGTYTAANGTRNGAIYVSGDATFSEGSILSLCIRKADNADNSRSHLEVVGKLTLNCKIRVDLVTYEPKEGDEIIFWSAGSFEGSPSSIELPELPEGLEWDATGLKDVSGILKVVQSSGINDVIDDGAQVVCHVYDMLGVCVGTVNTTKAQAKDAVKAELNLGTGIYILKFVNDKASESIKVQL